ncbi:hypothetical protein CKO38_10915 [Rhodospirillum rubrum]|uniref:UbiD family decarboxylase n=1 Tax=Rhodospirillum rubrum TaxID=1085 RepID=UPI0019060320|nr:UbiD family decarboxylase [Rhodospirillum rubrum]MBK1665296.1 hypothetical protein [Rhodospirillum rubrum]MBK1677165.1 hypothetical protein [Rhodospirillum rubrum]
MRSALQHALTFCVTRAITPDLEISRFLCAIEDGGAMIRPYLFSTLVGYPGFSIVMNLLTRETLLASLGLADADWRETAHRRLSDPQPRVVRGPSLASRAVSGLDSLPIMRHQPGDAGRYVTSAIIALADPDSGAINLGCYRIQVKDDRHCAVFMDPRTDGFTLYDRQIRRGVSAIPVTIFLGGPLGTPLIAAAALPAGGDDYAQLSALSAREVRIDDGGDGRFPAAPCEAEIVIHGLLTPTLVEEGPFGEFKGYYAGPTQSPLLKVVAIGCRPDPIFPGLQCGRHSGLTLMALQNELLLYHHLRRRGFSIDSVDYPLEAFGEYLCLIRSDEDGALLTQAAMDLDRRAKLVFVSRQTDVPLRRIAVQPIETRVETYIRHGAPEGQRIAIHATPINEDRRVDY